MVNSSFLFEAASCILNFLWSSVCYEDKLMRWENKEGRFSVSSCYNINVVIPDANDPGLWEGIWKLKIHDWLKLFIWRVMTRVIPTKGVLKGWEGVAWATVFADLKLNLCSICLKIVTVLDCLLLRVNGNLFLTIRECPIFPRWLCIVLSHMRVFKVWKHKFLLYVWLLFGIVAGSKRIKWCIMDWWRWEKCCFCSIKWLRIFWAVRIMWGYDTLRAGTLGSPFCGLA